MGTLPDSSPTLDETLAELQKLSIKTTQGDFVKVEDVQTLLKKRAAAMAVEEAAGPQPKTLDQAREAAKKDPEIMKHFPSRGPREPGRAVPAAPQPSSRT